MLKRGSENECSVAQETEYYLFSLRSIAQHAILPYIDHSWPHILNGIYLILTTFDRWNTPDICLYAKRWASDHSVPFFGFSMMPSAIDLLSSCGESSTTETLLHLVRKTLWTSIITIACYVHNLLFLIQDVYKNNKYYYLKK